MSQASSESVRWALTLAAGGITSAMVAKGQAHKRARDKLDKEGAFDAAKERLRTKLTEIYDINGREIVDLSQPMPPYKKEFAKKINRANQEYQSEVKRIMKKEGVDNFSGAWNSLSDSDQLKALGFAAVSGVVVGAIMHAFTKPSKNKGGDGHYYDGGADHHPGVEPDDFGHVYDGGGLDFGDFGGGDGIGL